MLNSLSVRTKLRSLIRRKVNLTSIVLCYHRVASVAYDPEALAVSPRHFAEHMEVVSKWQRCTVESLAGSRGRASAGVLVTLDDAYRDNLIHALPILQKHDVPAIVFAPSTLCQRGETFWWEVLRRLFEAQERIPHDRMERLYQSISKRGAALGAALAGAERSNGSGPPEAYRRFGLLLRLASDSQRRRFVEEGLALLGERGGVDEASPMNAAELRELSAGGLVEIGGHTRTHPQLANLSRAEQLEEIGGGRKELEAMLGRPVRSFAYPFGAPLTDFNADSVSAADEAGYSVAFAFAPSVVSQVSSRLEVGRFRVDDCDGDELARRMILWFGRPDHLTKRVSGAARPISA